MERQKKTYKQKERQLTNLYCVLAGLGPWKAAGKAGNVLPGAYVVWEEAKEKAAVSDTDGCYRKSNGHTWLSHWVMAGRQGKAPGWQQKVVT